MNSKQADENSHRISDDHPTADSHRTTDDRTREVEEVASDVPASTETAHFVTCENCEHVWYYERAVCPNCHSRSFDRVPSKTGTVVARTTVHVTPDGVPQPLELGLVSYEEGGHVLGQLADETVSRGQFVVLAGTHELRRESDGSVTTGPKIHAVPRDAETDIEEAG